MSYQNSEMVQDKILCQKMQYDRPLLYAVIFLVIIGLMAIFSASAPKCVELGVNPMRFFLQQLACAVIGFVGMVWLSNFHYKKLINVTLLFSAIVIGLLIMVKVAGTTVNGAQRWIYIGSMSFQPSELAKPAIVLLLAGAFCKDTKFNGNNKMTISFVLIGIMLLLIYAQPNLSMVILLLATSCVMYICAGGSMKNIMWMGGIGVFLLFLKGLRGYQASRLSIWLHPESDPLGAGYNIIQSLVAFASGGLYGVGYGSSKQKLAWLPEAHTDFIYAVIGEEHGFIGCLLIICLFWTILYRGFLIACKCQDMYGKLLALGMTFSICFQGFLNMGVASSFVPATGVPMPFVSYGGSSVIVSLLMVGVLLNISKDNVRKIRNYGDARRIR